MADADMKWRKLDEEKTARRQAMKEERLKQQELKKRMQKLRKDVENKAKADALKRAKRYTLFNPEMDPRVYEICINRYQRKLDKVPLPKVGTLTLKSNQSDSELVTINDLGVQGLTSPVNEANKENLGNSLSSPLAYGDLIKSRRGSRAHRETARQEQHNQVRLGWQQGVNQIAVPVKPLEGFTPLHQADIIEELYTAEEKELLQIPLIKTDKVRIVPSKAEQDPSPQSILAREKLQWLWGMQPSWVVMWSNGSPPQHPPHHMFDGNYNTMWSPAFSMPNQEHWCVLDFRCMQVVDGLRLESHPFPHKHLLKHFRLETGESAGGPWKVVDHYEYRNSSSNIREPSVEAWYGFSLRTRYIRLYLESAVSNYQPRIHKMELRLKSPIIYLPRPMSRKKKANNNSADGSNSNSDSSNSTTAWAPEPGNGGGGGGGVGGKGSNSVKRIGKGHKLPQIPINPDVQIPDFRPGSLLHIRGEGFSLVPKDNIIDLICMEDDRPPPVAPRPEHSMGMYKHRRITPGSYAPDKDYLPSIKVECTGCSQRHLQLRVIEGQLSRVHLDSVLSAQVTVHGIKMQVHVPVARVFEQVLDPYLFVQQKCQDPDPEELLRVLKFHIKKPEVQYWGLRAIATCSGSGMVLPSAYEFHKNRDSTGPVAEEYDENKLEENRILAIEEAMTDKQRSKRRSEEEHKLAERAAQLRATLKPKFGAYTALTEDGVPHDLVLLTIETVLQIMTAHPKHARIQAWGCLVLSANCDEHATRVALMGFDWLEVVVEPMKTLVEQKAITTRTQDKETLQMTHETYHVVPQELEELALHGLQLLCGMAREDGHREYVAAQGIPAVLHCMGECEGEDHCLTQAYACLCLFNMVYRSEDAWKQCQECDAIAYVETAKELNLLDEQLQKNATNAWHALQVDGWKGRKLVADMQLNEMANLRDSRQKHSKKMEAKLAKMQEDGRL